MMSADAFKRSDRGMSLIEMMVCVLIIGIATAGLSTLLGLDVSYILRLSNKSDNMINAQYALDRLSRELRMAARVDSNSAGTLLCFYVPEFDSNSQAPNGGYGFPTMIMDQYIYQVKAATAAQKDNGHGMPSSHWIVTRYVQIGSPSISVTDAGAMSQVDAKAMPVMNGVVGPLTGLAGEPKIFEYISLTDSLQSLQSTAQSGAIGAVVINVEMMRANQAQANGVTDQLSMRSEVALRNATGLMR